MTRTTTVIVATLLLGGSAIAQTANSFITGQKPQAAYFTFQSSTAINTFQQLYPQTGETNPNGVVCSGGYVSNNDSISHALTLQVRDSSGNVVETWQVNVALDAGFETQTQPIIGPTITAGLAVDANGNQAFFVPAGGTIFGAYSPAMTSGFFLYSHADCWAY